MNKSIMIVIASALAINAAVNGYDLFQRKMEEKREKERYKERDKDFAHKQILENILKDYIDVKTRLGSLESKVLKINHLVSRLRENQS